eukprot:scaffold87787_cov37-Phaeocystis_antarctica.AAC.1
MGLAQAGLRPHTPNDRRHQGHQPLREERVGKAVPGDLHTVLAPSGEERTLNAAAQVERAGRCCRRFDSDTQTRCGSVTVIVLVSSASGPRVSGYTRACRY